MSYDYKYNDSDYVYTDPKTGVLRNKHGIEDEQLLHITESLDATTRLIELAAKPIKIKSADSLLKIHGYIFQDTYDWAGKVRTVEISKQGKPFHPTDRFDAGFLYVNNLIDEYRGLGDEPRALAKCLALILDAVNTLHPFREGNGRTQREFIRTLALEKGYRLDLNPADDESVYKQYMTGTIEGDVSLLASLIESVMEK
ncbi:MAG: Fic family protein [Clostridiales bacterium]|nr:Fic family protein [Clostridiales bacterium]